MKKIISFLLFTAIMQQAISQTETFDIATFTPPKDFKKDSKQGVVIYSNANATTGGFCMIAIYASTASAGNEQKDFTNEWKDLVVTPYKAEANPKTETQTSPDGWKVVAAAAPIKLGDIDAYSILTVFSGFGKKFSVLSTLNNQSYISMIDSLLQNIKLDKTKDWKGPNIQKGNLNASGIVGVYGKRELRQYVEAGITKMGESGTYYIFFSNGQVYQFGGFPRDGLEGLNTLAAAVQDTFHWSTYSFQNGKGTYKIHGIEYSLTMIGTGVAISRGAGSSGKYPYPKILSVDGAVFNGTYIIESIYHDDNLDGNIIFTADGKFIDNGPLNILNHRQTDSYNITEKPGSGTYEVKNYTVIFKYTDGRILHIAFPGINYDKKNQSPEKMMMSFKEDVLIKKL